MPDKLIVFLLDDQRYALRLFAVERIVRMVEITPLPKAPDIVMGVINLQGRILPIFNMRKRFGLVERVPDLNDHLIIARTSRRGVGLFVDEVVGILEHSGEETVRMESILPGLQYVEGVIKLEDGMALIHNLELFLSLDEEKALANVLETPPEIEQ